VYEYDTAGNPKKGATLLGFQVVNAEVRSSEVRSVTLFSATKEMHVSPTHGVNPRRPRGSDVPTPNSARTLSINSIKEVI
jgi:hypothetical protein